MNVALAVKYDIWKGLEWKILVITLGGASQLRHALCVSPDTQAHSFECPIVKKNVHHEAKLEDIFSTGAKREIARTLQHIVKFRENYMEK